MKSVWLNKFKDSFLSILPITLIVIILGVSLVPLSGQNMLNFCISCVLLVVGIALFTMGADNAMLPIGQHMGGHLSKKNKPWLTILFCFILGVVITVAEPDLSVLADQVSSVNSWVLILTVSVGVGLFLVLGLLRMFFKWHFNLTIAISYILIFIVAIFLDAQIIPLSFDSGSVTTGPISVPFIMAFGIGLASSRASNSKEDSFGLIGFASAGPILVVMLLLGILNVHDASAVAGTDITFFQAIPVYLKDVAIIILPIAVLFIIFQIFALKLPKKEIWRIVVGLLFTYFGIVIFLVGVNVGFLPVGKLIGQGIAANYPGWLVPICAGVGFCMAMVEPAVQVLASQIENITGATVKKITMLLCIAIGVAIALGLCAIRILTHISILWILIPAYVLVIVLSFIAPKLFVGIAYDSGGVATGAIATTFALPMMLGACTTLGGNVLLDAFGTLAFCAVAPILVVMTFGVIYKAGENKAKGKEENLDGLKRIDIIEYD